MPQLSIAKTYANGTVLFEADLDEIKDAIELLINTTGVDEDNIQDGAVVTDLLAASAVTGAKIADEAITTSLLASDSATSTTIANDAVTSDKIAASAVTTAKILDGAVTYEKIAPNEVSCSISGSLGTTSADKSGGGAEITTTGRPVLVECFSGIFVTTNVGSGVKGCYFELKRSGTVVGTARITFSGTIQSSYTSVRIPLSSLAFVDEPAAGTYTYTLWAYTDSSASASLSGSTMYIREL